jgi:uncharacterized protein YlaN (UPF0358 family)
VSAVPRERIPFAEAVSEPLLFAKQWEALTPGIRAILRFTYGLPVTKDDLSYWHAYHGAGRFDPLGYLLDSWDSGVEYVPGQECTDLTLIVGRRSTKTSGVSSFIVAYEALLGGHRNYVGFKSQQVVLLQVAQDLAAAKANLRQFIYDLIDQSPVGRKELEGKPVEEVNGERKKVGAKKQNVTALSLSLKNGSLITVGAPTMKLRGQAVPIFCGDEVAFWSKDKDAANPDSEVIRAVTPAMASFPHRKLVLTSTPMTEEGALWEAAQIGSYGRFLTDSAKREAHARTLVFQGPSAPLAPAIVLPREVLEEKRLKDPEGFQREYLARFAKSVSGFLSVNLLRASVEKGVTRRKPDPRHLYVATMDPAFRGDAFAFAIGHVEGGIYVLDFIEAWRGTQAQPISPSVAMASVASICRDYGLRMVTSDQHHSDSLMEIAQQQGLVMDSCPLTNKLKIQMWGEVQGLLSQGKLRLLDNENLLTELAKLEKILTPGSVVKFEGKHDDLAVVMALNVYRALQYGEKSAPIVEKVVPDWKPLSTQIRERILGRERGATAWWNS